MCSSLLTSQDASASKQRLVKQKNKAKQNKTKTRQNRLAVASVNKLKRGDTLVLDLDNTLFDTRPRKLKALKEFSKLHKEDLPSDVFEQIKNASLSDVRYDAKENVRKFRIPKGQEKEFRRIWNNIFWSPDSLRYDKPMNLTIGLVKAAEKRGVTIKYLSGRYASFYNVSVLQIRQALLPLRHKDNLMLRPKESDTAEFKANALIKESGKGKVILLDDSPSTVSKVYELRRFGIEPIHVVTKDQEPLELKLPQVKSLHVD